MDIKIQAALFDVLNAAQLVQDFLSDKTFENYQSDLLLKSAVERQFITIGEALNKAIQQLADLSTQITDARRIIDFRNVLTHGYTSISDEVIWDIVQTNLPILVQEVQHFLNQSDSATLEEESS